METTKTQLEARRSQVQAEQADLRQELNEWRQQVGKLEEQRKRLLRQYDVGIDEAGPQAAQCLDEIEAAETAIARIEKQLAEFPDRIHNLNVEIALAGHRAGLHELLALRRDEIAAFDDYEQAAITFFTAYHQFNTARQVRYALESRLRSTAAEHGLPKVPDGNFDAPTGRAFSLWLAEHPQRIEERLKSDFAKARQGIVVV